MRIIRNLKNTKTKFPKIFLLPIAALFIAANFVYAQSCNTLKEIFENSNHCDKSEVSIHAKVYEILDKLTLRSSEYAYGFQITDDEQYIVRVISKDNLFLFKDDEVVIDGRYYKTLYADGLNLNDTIITSGKDIKVILTGEDYTDLFVNHIDRSILENESLQKRLQNRDIIFAALIPLFSVGAFVAGYVWYRRRKYKGALFEGYVEGLFSKKEWRIAESNAYRKLGRWVESYSNPDFVFIHRRTNKKIAVECKYKEKEYERILWAYEDQIERYQNFSQKQNISVFVILGIGGRPKNPKRVFLAPLSQIKYPDVKIDYLKKFERDPKKYFSLDNRNDLI